MISLNCVEHVIVNVGRDTDALVERASANPPPTYWSLSNLPITLSMFEVRCLVSDNELIESFYCSVNTFLLFLFNHVVYVEYLTFGKMINW